MIAIDRRKFCGIFPAFYTCYEDNGQVSKERTKALLKYLFDKGVRGVYITGSSAESIYLTTEERIEIMNVIAEATKGKMTVIAHVGAPSTDASIQLAKHANKCGFDAISSIPPVYFPLSEAAIKEYWNAMIEASGLPFIIYNIPATTGVNVSESLFKEMLKNPYVIGMKNTSLPVMDMLKFKTVGGEKCVIFNGPDEQFVMGRLMGADSGIGGTYCVMPELFLKMDELLRSGDIAKASIIQKETTALILRLIGMEGHMLAVAKEILKIRGLNVGKARLPLPPVSKTDLPKVVALEKDITETIKKYC